MVLEVEERGCLWMLHKAPHAYIGLEGVLMSGGRRGRANGVRGGGKRMFMKAASLVSTSLFNSRTLPAEHL